MILGEAQKILRVDEGKMEVLDCTKSWRDILKGR